MNNTRDVKLRPLAWEVNEEAIRQISVFRAEMPKCWVDYIGKFQTNPAEPYKITIKIKNLAVKLQSIFPEIIWMNDRGYWQPGEPWIVSTSKIPMNMMSAFCMGWFQGQVSKAKEQIVLPPEPDEDDLQWKAVKVSEVLSSNNEYQLIPALVANQFCQSPKSIPVVEGCELPKELSFSQVHAKDAECMSQLLVTKKGTYAYVIRLRMKTRGGQPDKKILLFSLGIRRFVSEPYITADGCMVKGDTKSSILVSLDNPFLRERGYGSRSFAKIWFQRKGPRTMWVDHSDEVFWDVLWNRRITPNEILREPKSFIKPDSDVQAFVVYNRLFQKSSIGAGTGFPEKEAFFQLLSQELANWRPLDSLPQLKRLRNQSKSYNQLPPLFSIEPKRITLEVWGTEYLFEQTNAILENGLYQKKPLSFKEGTNLYKLNSCDDVLVQLEYKGAPALLGSLNVAEFNKVAYDHRVIEIEEAFSKHDSQSRLCSLVEILPGERYAEGTDPKLAIREGFRRTGRLTQFIHPEDEVSNAKLEYRLLNALLDIFSDSGIMDKSVGQLPPDINILGFDILNVKKRNAESRFGEEDLSVPIFTKFFAGGLSIRGWGMDRWITLQEAMLQADLFKGWKSYKEVQVLQLVDEVLREEVLNHDKNYILLNAELRNNHVKSIRNGEIHPDKIPAVLPWLDNVENVRFIRINTTDEVPSYLFESRSYSSGVFKDRGGIYYGVGRKMDTIQIKKTKTKYSNPTEFFRQPKNTEYIPLGFTNEVERDQTALLVHDLRDIGITFGTHTAQPYPFHMLRSLKKYIDQTAYKEWALEPEFADDEG